MKHGKPKTPEDQANKATEENMNEEVALSSLDEDDYVCIAMSEGEPEEEGNKRRRTEDQEENRENDLTDPEFYQYDSEEETSEGTDGEHDNFQAAMMRDYRRDDSPEIGRAHV